MKNRTEIHKLISDPEIIEPVKLLLKEFMNEYETHNGKAWDEVVKKESNGYYFRNLLNEGQCDFDKPTNGLTPEELIVIYNYHYFPMYYLSSRMLFTEIWNIGFSKHFINESNPIFIDIGSGSLASSLAFLETLNSNILFPDYFLGNSYEWTNGLDPIDFSKERSLIYYVNASSNILESGKKTFAKIFDNIANQSATLESGNSYPAFAIDSFQFGKQILKCCSLGYVGPQPLDSFYFDNELNLNPINEFLSNNARLNHSIESSKKQFSPHIEFNLVDDYINGYNAIHKQTNFSIIINFCCAFENQSLDLDVLSQSILKIVNQNKDKNICIICQNPEEESQNNKWVKFKQLVNMKAINGGSLPINHFSNTKVNYEVLFRSKFEIF